MLLKFLIQIVIAVVCDYIVISIYDSKGLDKYLIWKESCL